MTRNSGLTLLTLGMIALFSLPAHADDAKLTVDPSGTWRWEHDEQGQTIKDILRINFDADTGKGSGTYEGRIGPIELEEVEVEGDQLSCEFEVDFDGGSIEVEFEGKVEGDTVTGVVEISAGQDGQEFPWVAKRSVEESDVLGTWDIRIELNDGNTLTPSLKISHDDDKLVAEYTSTNAEVELNVEELAVADNNLTFTISAEFNGNTLTANYDVAPRGDKFSGTVAYDFNGQTGELDVDGARQTDDDDDEEADDDDDDDDDDDGEDDDDDDA